MKTSPIRYTPQMEHYEEDEEKIAAELGEIMLSISKKTYADSGHAMRSVHVKSHALLQGELHVLKDLPEPLAQGIFQHPATYPVILRLSTIPGDILPDSVSTPRGLAIKIVGVKGERLPGSEDAVTQDFVMANWPAFLKPNAKAFISGVKLLAMTTDRGEGIKVAGSTLLRGVEKAIEAVGNASPIIKSIGGEPAHHPLGEIYYTQVPMLHGPYMGKLSVAPISPELRALTGKEIDITHNPYALREAILDFFAMNGGEWEVRIQLCTDLDAMPIEDASIIWPEDKSPYIAVARIVVKPQSSWSEARSVAIDDGMSFSPWHGLAVHRPLGSIMRVRKIVYEMSSHFRAQRNNKTLQEPRNLKGLFTDNDPAPSIKI